MEKGIDAQEIAKQLLLRGEEKLVSAEVLLEKDRIDDAISRAYYAAFLAARGLLYLLGMSPQSQSGVVTMFGLKVVKEGLLSANIGHALNELFEARETSDYAVIVYFTEEDGIKYIEKAKEIINSIKILFENKFQIEF